MLIIIKMHTMKELYNDIKAELEVKKRSFSWLAEQVGYSRQGLKTSLVNKNIKYDTLMKIANLLEVNITRFFIHDNIETLPIDEQLHSVRYQSKLEMKYVNELTDENTRLTRQVSELKKEIETYRKMVSILFDDGVKKK